MQDASALADSSLDELFGIVFGILMDNRNIDAGMDYLLANRWISEFRKGNLNKFGSLAVATGGMSVNYSVEEDLDGAEALNVADGETLGTEIETTIESEDGLCSATVLTVDP